MLNKNFRKTTCLPSTANLVGGIFGGIGVPKVAASYMGLNSEGKLVTQFFEYLVTPSHM